MARRVERCKAFKMGKEMEARAGIEPTYEDLQSSAWPLCHRAGSGRIRRVPTWRPCLASARIGPIRRGGQAWAERAVNQGWVDRKSTRLNSSHSQISYAVFCLKKK